MLRGQTAAVASDRELSHYSCTEVVSFSNDISLLGCISCKMVWDWMVWFLSSMQYFDLLVFGLEGNV